MKSRFTKLVAGIVAVLALSVASLRADTVKVKFSELAELGASLRGLDGAEREVKTSDQGTRVIRVSFDLKPAARIAIAKNLSAVRTALEAFEAQRQSILQSVSPGAPEKVQTDPALLAKFADAWNALAREPVAIEVAMISEDQLNLEANKEITGTILAGLAPVLSAKK